MMSAQAADGLAISICSQELWGCGSCAFHCAARGHDRPAWSVAAGPCPLTLAPGGKVEGLGLVVRV